MDANKKRKITFEDDSYRPKKNSRWYSNSYFDFGFKFILQNGEEKTSVCYMQHGIGQ